MSFNRLFFGVLVFSLLVIPAAQITTFAQVDKITADSNSDMEQYMYLIDEYESLNYDELPLKYPVGNNPN